jgi:hypothetical protein
MGIIMEKLSNTFPQIQESITSAYENVTAGIAENVKSTGISGLDSTYEIFSDSNLIAGDFNSFQSLSEPAAYPDPAFSSEDVSTVLKDRNFNAQRELATLFAPGWDKIGDWVNQLLYPRNMDQSIGEHNIDGKLADEAARKQAKGAVSDVAPNPPTAVPPDSKLLAMEYPNIHPNPYDRLGDMYGASLVRLSPTNTEAMDRLREDQSIDGRLADGAARKQAKGPVSEVVPDPPTALPASVTPPPQQSYFQTIDQTAEKLQTNPQPETAQLFQQQFTAVQDMSSAVKESLDLYQQLNFNSGFNRR